VTYSLFSRTINKNKANAYFGVLILAGVFNGESTEFLWDAENGREAFCATMSLENIISRIICFDNQETRPAQWQRDKVAAIRSVWNKWVDRLPLFTTLGPTLRLMSSLCHLEAAAPSGSTYSLNPQNMESRSRLPVMLLHHMSGT
jgi:hypothetical protein